MLKSAVPWWQILWVDIKPPPIIFHQEKERMLKIAEKPHLSFCSDPDLKLGFLVQSSTVISFIIALKFISGKTILIRFLFCWFMGFLFYFFTLSCWLVLPLNGNFHIIFLNNSMHLLYFVELYWLKVKNKLRGRELDVIVCMYMFMYGCVGRRSENMA